MNYYKNIDVIDSYDVIVAGGGPSGICAAIAAKEMGMKVLIIERAGVVGGNLTIGHVSPISGGHVKNSAAYRINMLINSENYSVNNFEEAKIKLTCLLEQNDISVLLNSSVCDVIREDNEIRYVIFSSQEGLKAVEGKFFIDATGDAVLSYLANEEIEYGRKDGLVQPTSIMFTITGVESENDFVCCHEADDTILKKGSYLKLCMDACESGELPPEINIVRLYMGNSKKERVVNATQVNRLNPLKAEDYSKAQITLRKQMNTVLNFLKNNVEGFENISIKDSSDIVGVRESRRVKGYYTLTADDIIKGSLFPDVIVHKAAFCIDIHNPDGAGQALEDFEVNVADAYDIPYRAIVPLVNKNLLVAGRCISGTHRAHASYRVMNIAMNIGEAAGIAAALCVMNCVNNSELDYRLIQECLTKKDIDLFN